MTTFNQSNDPDYAEQMLQVATLLANQPTPNRACLRRSISTAYYAVFHTLQYFCARSLITTSTSDSKGFDTVFRSLNHNKIRGNVLYLEALKNNPQVKKIIDHAVKLKAERYNADYGTPLHGAIDSLDALLKIEMAREAIQLLKKLPSDTKRLLAINLLFDERSKP